MHVNTHNVMREGLTFEGGKLSKGSQPFLARCDLRRGNVVDLAQHCKWGPLESRGLWGRWMQLEKTSGGLQSAFGLACLCHKSEKRSGVLGGGQEVVKPRRHKRGGLLVAEYHKG